MVGHVYVSWVEILKYERRVHLNLVTRLRERGKGGRNDPLILICVGTQYDGVAGQNDMCALGTRSVS